MSKPWPEARGEVLLSICVWFEKDADFTTRVVTMDETSVYFYYPETK